MSIRMVASGLDVGPLVDQLAAHPELWDQHTLRTTFYGTPHAKISDIWVRYNAWENLNGDADAFVGPHKSVWYPCISAIPAAWSLARKVFRRVRGKTLGGVLITRIPPGGRVEPHIDGGWHARHYEKFGVQVKSNAEQSFCFEDAELRPLPGDMYTFDNSKLHWVENPSAEERITMIVCVKR